MEAIVTHILHRKQYHIWFKATTKDFMAVWGKFCHQDLNLTLDSMTSAVYNMDPQSPEEQQLMCFIPLRLILNMTGCDV